ncbi:hypothetical protein BH18ACT4_BH18ACT4_05010 [soil metagenome]
MSAENVALVRSVSDNFAKGDIPAVVAALDAEVEWVESPQAYLPFRGTHRGPEEVVAGVFGAVMKHFEEFAVVPERFHDAGEVVVVEGRAVGKTMSGQVLDARAAWVWTVRDGRIVANHNYHDTDEFRVALSA